MKPYPLDHCVLPTRSLAAARARLSALGFTVAADAAHPFGTANCCVFFEDDTYLEPLAIVAEDLTAAAIQVGNTFVDRDRHYRAVQGDEGFSAFVLGTADADADHARFVGEGVSAGSILSFSRPFVDAHGVQGEASFKLAFAAPIHSEVFFFTCERVKSPSADRATLQRHRNGVIGISHVLLTASRPGDYENFLSLFCGIEPLRRDAGPVEFAMANATVSLIPPALASALDMDGSGGLGLSGITFLTQYLPDVRGALAAAEIHHEVRERRIVVPPAVGQGATFIFEEFQV
ncbi:VOC family protein [Chelativorans sp. YIM 93263]|uniref:VOC family protein n=1 Tax=Chelativorans sp. YIM 93263 TaxID=2906648 RepID=UPI002379508A|nr:VOC family protein [Chelativorans sp. YIM 93263]